MKRTLSVILALVLLFAALPLAAGAAESDIAETGRSYNLWIGKTQVTDANKNDILGDDTASFDSNTNTLRLNDPTIRDYYNDFSEICGQDEYSDNIYLKCKIFASGMSLNVIGYYHMPDTDISDQCYGLYIENGSVTFDGDFAFYGNYCGVYVKGDVSIAGGRFEAMCFTNYRSVAPSAGISAKGKVRISSSVEYIKSIGINAGITFGEIDWDDSISAYSMEEPTSPIIQGDLSKLYSGNYLNVKTFYYLYSEDTPVRIVCFKDNEYHRHHIWLGRIQVTDNNKNDILYDGGKAKYDSDSGILILDNPSIFGLYQGEGSCKIYSDIKLTVKGEYHMTSSESDYGIYSRFRLTLDGIFTFKGNNRAIETVNDTLKILNVIEEPNGGVIKNGTVYSENGKAAKTVKIVKGATISYDPNGGGGNMGPVTVKQGSVYTLPECTFNVPYGKTFKGWSFDGSLRQPGEQIIVNDDCTLTAIWWTPCTVSFDPNGGSGSMEPVTLEKGSSYTLPECTFTPPSGKVFGNWRISGVYATYAPGDSITVSADKTVEAVWKNASTGTYSISGSVTSFLSDTDQTTITLSKKSGDNYVVKGTQTVSGNSASYVFNDISRMSQYKLTVSKKNHVDREYTVTVLVSSKTVDVKICPIGDVNGDGSVTNFDYSKVNQHVCKIEGKELTDYAFACADVNKDGSVTNFDAGKINQHVCKVKSLFQ